MRLSDDEIREAVDRMRATEEEKAEIVRQCMEDNDMGARFSVMAFIRRSAQ